MIGVLGVALISAFGLSFIAGNSDKRTYEEILEETLIDVYGKEQATMMLKERDERILGEYQRREMTNIKMNQILADFKKGGCSINDLEKKHNFICDDFMLKIFLSL